MATWRSPGEDLLLDQPSGLPEGFKWDDEPAATPAASELPEGFKWDEPTPEEDRAVFEQGVKEAGKGLAAGAITGAGSAIKGVAGGLDAQRAQVIADAKKRIAIMDAYDKGQNPKSDPNMVFDDDTGTLTLYPQLDPEQRKELRQQQDYILKTAQPPNPNVTATPLYKAGEATEKFGQEQFGPAKDWENSYTTQFTQALGSTVPLAVTQRVLGPFGALAGGAAMSAGQQLDDAIAHGAKPEQIYQAVKLGALPGLTEDAPIELLFSKLPVGKYGKFVDALFKASATAAAEGGQEGAQQFMQNLIAKWTYNPDQDLSENVLLSAGLGAAVGGSLAGVTIAPSLIKPDQTKAAKPATPPGVADSPDAGVAAPGGVAATTPPQPAGAERAAPAAGAVTPVAPAAVPPDVGAALGQPAPPAATPAPAPVTSLPEPAPVAEEEIEPAEPETEEDQGAIAEREAALQEALTARAAERQAAATPVAPSGVDEAAALTAAAQPKRTKRTKRTAPEPMPTPEAASRIAQPEQVPQVAQYAIQGPTPVAAPVSQPAPQVVPGAVAGAPAPQEPVAAQAQNQPAPASLPPRQRLRALGYTAEDIAGLEPDEIQQILDREEAPPQPDVELTQALPAVPLTETVQALPAGFTWDDEAAPAAQPQGAPLEGTELAPVLEATQPPRPPVAPQQPAPRPQLTPIGRQLAERVVQEVTHMAAQRPQFEEMLRHPDLVRVAEEVAHERTRDLPRGTAPRQAVEQLLPEAGLEVGKRLTQTQQQEQAARTAAEERQARAQEVSKETQAKARTEGAAQERARKPREKGKEKKGEEFAAQSEKALKRRVSEEMAKPEAERHPRLQRIANLMEIRAGKHPRKKAPLSEAIKEEAAAYAEELKTKEAEREAAKPKEEPRPQLPAKAEALGRALTAEEKTAVARDEAAAKQRERSKQLTASVSAVTSSTEDFEFPSLFTPKAAERARDYINNLVDRVSKAVGGTKLLDDVSPKKTGPEENFAIWLKGVAKKLNRDPSRARTEQSIMDVWQALKFLKSGDTDNLYGLISDAPIDAREMSDAVTGDAIASDWAASGEQDVIDTFEPSADLKPGEAAPRRPRSGRGTVTLKNPVTGVDVEVNVEHQEQAGSLLTRMARQLEKSGLAPWRGSGFGIFRRMHYKALRNLVGDVPVYMIDHESMLNLSGGKAALGMFASTDPSARGQYIVLDYDLFSEMDEQTWAETLAHEMTHAATVYALKFNINGTQQIVATMRRRLETQLKAAGVFDQLTGDARNAFKNDREFIAEAYSSADFQELLTALEVSPWVADRIGRLGEPKASWWRTFAAAVANALGFGGSRPSITYFEAALALHPHITMSREAQAADYRSHLPSLKLLDSADMKLSVGRARDAAMQRIGESWSDLRQSGAWTRLATTQELVRRAERMGSEFAEAFKAHAHAFLGGHQTFEKLRDLSDALSARLARYRDNHHQAFADLQEVIYRATNAGVDPSAPPHADNNAHIYKTGHRHEHLRAEYKRLKPLYDALPAEAKQLFQDLGAHYAQTYDRKLTETLRTMIEGGIVKHGLTLPPGEDVSSAIKWVMDGDIDRPAAKDPANRQPGERSKRDDDLHKALGGLAKSLTGSHEMRKINGYYAPLTRTGKYFLAAREAIATPAGAFKRPTASPNDQLEFIFDGPDAKKNVKAYTSATDDQIMRTISEWRDKTTGKPSNPNDVNAEQVFRVQVQNRVFEMHDNRHHLERRGDELARSGYQVDAVAETDRLQGHADQILPSQINRLIRNAEQSTQGNVTAGQKAVVGGIMSAYIKQLSGSRAGHRRLKRKGYKGFDRDIVDSTFRVGRTEAAHIANLERSRELAKSEARLNEVIKNSRQARKTGQIPMQRMAFELAHRINNATTRGDDTWTDAALRTVTDVSFLTHLASLGYSFAQLAQPHMMAYPVLARHFNKGSAMWALTTAFRDIQAHKVIGRGFAESGKAAANIGRYARKPYDYAAAMRARLGRLPDGPLMQRAADRLEQLQFGIGSGIEHEEVAEHGRTLPGKVMNRTVRMARQLPQAMEAVNRMVTLVAAVRLGKRAGLSDEAIIDRAVNAVEQSQGGYAKENNPAFFNNRWLKVPLQFKKFGLLYGQLYYGAVKDLALAPGERAAAAKQLVRLSAMTMIFAGLGGQAFMELAKTAIMAANLVGLDDNDWEDWENGLQQWFADALKWLTGSKGVGRKASEVIMHGATRALGFDTSSRLGNENLLLFGDPRSMQEADVKSWLFNMMVGAPGGTVSDFVLKGKLPYPKVVRDLMKTYEHAAAGEYGAAVGQAAGFRSAKEAEKYEAFGGGFAKKKEQALKKDRSDLMGKYWEAEAGSDRNRVWREIRDWNRSHKDQAQKIEYGDLQRSGRTRKQHAREEKRREREYQ